MFQFAIDSITFDQIIDQVLKPQTKILDNKQFFDEMSFENYLNKQYGFSILNSYDQQHDDDSPQNVNYLDQNQNFMNVQEDQFQINPNNSQENGQEYYLMFDSHESLELLKIQKEIHLKSVKRKDVALKTAIREIRRTYLQQFNENRKYSSVSRNRHQKYYLFAIQRFVAKLFQSSFGFEEKQIDDPALSQNQLFNELVFFLGSTFYPNKMMRLIDDESGKKIIKLIDVSIHQFTYQRLCFLCKWDAFKHIFQHYLDAFNLKQNQKKQHIASSSENFEKSINFLKGMILR
ncbi:UNKNOWN [Stylonychia lemnae]|uniref:Uncharacterized protein n=1 Tax=Stylonychia lemnae TaxID=5949 RepID=A0A078AYN1_STYLE|nr:UNKNOWN [Stylonychia lemnae]|eukprot:CDW86322.1 UNKNOWN [Stylonychia lemnae]